MTQVNLFRHQEAHFQRMLDILHRFYFCIDGSTPGAGKTIIASKMSQVTGLPIIVFGPTTARMTWENAARMYQLKNYSLKVRDNGNYINTFFLNYEKLRGTGKSDLGHDLLYRYKDDVGKTRFAVTEMFIAIARQGALFIFDECQKLKNKSSLTWAAVKVMMKYIYQSGGISRSMFLSGTLMDKEEQVPNFLRLVSFVEADKMFNTIDGVFTIEGYGVGEARSWARIVNPEGLATMDAKTPPNKLRKDKVTKYVFDLFQDVMKPKLMSVMPKSDFSDKKNGFYLMEPEDEQAYITAIYQLGGAARYNPQEGTVHREQNQLGAIAIALIAIQKAKMRMMARVISQVLNAVMYNNKGEQLFPKVLVFSDYKTEVLIPLSELLYMFNPELMIGNTKQNDRNDINNEFNEPNNNIRLILANKTVAGTSRNFHDTDGHFPRYIFLFPDYMINELEQAAERTNREGAKSISTIRFVYGLARNENSGVLELSIMSALNRKGDVMGKILEDQKVRFPGQYDNNFEVDPRTIYGEEFFKIPGVDDVDNYIAGKLAIKGKKAQLRTLEEDMAAVALEDRPEDDDDDEI